MPSPCPTVEALGVELLPQGSWWHQAADRLQLPHLWWVLSPLSPASSLPSPASAATAGPEPSVPALLSAPQDPHLRQTDVTVGTTLGFSAGTGWEVKLQI